MSKKLILVLVVTGFFARVSFARAEILINEFVSDPESGSEWVELWNNSSEEIALSGWKWTELAGPGGDTEHESSPKSLSGTISPGGFFVFEMASALNNAGDSIGLYHDTTLEDRVSFGAVSGYSKDLEAPAKGRSGALVNGSWETDQVPTQGNSNPTAARNDSGGSSASSDGETTANNSPSSSKKPAPAPKIYPIKVEILADKVALVGVPFTFEGRGTGENGEKLSRGKYFWNFGDGDFREVKASLKEKFTHTYFYPGEYTVVFDYYGDSFAEDPVASDQMTIKVIEPKIAISAVGPADDFFVEITNKTDSSADLSGWVIMSAYKFFTFPKNTTLGAGKKIILAPSVTGFNAPDAPTLKLMTPEREIVFDYYPAASVKVARNKISSSENLTIPDVPSTEEGDPEATGGGPALALGGMDENGNEKEVLPAGWGLSGFILLLSGASFAVYRIRRKAVAVPEGEDFEILDE